ncbi:MAG TPA: rhombosortase [Gammaproteobacteria bacterium]|nr:rhombosortase [Gammaproteobacteria bacterium]
MPLERISRSLRLAVEAFRLDRSNGAVLLTVVALLLLLGAGGEEVTRSLRYDREALARGELWRLVTGHLVHLNAGHLLLNAAGLGMVWLLFATEYTLARWALVAAAGLVAMNAGFWWLKPELVWYVGLSGLLHTLFAAGCVRWIAEGARDGWLVAALFAGKLVWEQTAGPLPFTESSTGGPVIVEAHLFGAAGGTLAALAFAVRDRHV